MINQDATTLAKPALPRYFRLLERAFCARS